MSHTFKIRSANKDDVLAILDVHRLAVRGTAASHYDKEIIEDWSPFPVPPERTAELTERIESGEEQMIVVEDDDARIIGFGSIVPSLSQLRAVYVSPDAGRKGIGNSILKRLEEMARDAGLTELQMDSSINAEPFYKSHGYTVIEYGEHALRSGRKMAPIAKMHKILSKGLP